MFLITKKNTGKIKLGNNQICYQQRCREGQSGRDIGKNDIS